MAIPVAVIGAGSFGTCLALLCARENDVTIWARSADLADAINRDHRNPRYLTDVELPDREERGDKRHKKESDRGTTHRGDCDRISRRIAAR